MTASWSARCRCENVPRSVSWPVSRTGIPSTTSVASASASAWPQSIPPSSSASRRRSSWRASFGLTVKPSGVATSSRSSSRSRLSGTAVSTSPEPAGGVAPLCSGGSAMDARSRSCASRSTVRRVVDQLLRVRLGDDPLLDQLLGELGAHRRLLRDLLRHQRLRVRRLVLLVVPEAAVADEVDDDVVPEPLAEGQREPDRGHRRLRIIGVDMDDRRVEALREIARVARRATLGGIGREPDLVVRDHVQRAAGRVAGQPLEVERLGDDALAGERGVAVDEDRQRDRRVVTADAGRAVGLRRARPTLDDGVDGLEVARVRHERDGDVARRRLRGRLPPRGGT